ncbi:MAG TPA: lysylphosphatidylglycerol synthase transmembrane domain-containing protein [Hyphomonadaceae bacterium]|nr:lysylphosphatidylglycerol synthase transmembrane domain-containing protein [Hyphomonadaceae bacterium]
MSATPEAAPPAAPKSVGWATRIAKAPWRLIGIVLLVVVLLNIDLNRLLQQFERLGPGPIVMAAGAFVLLLVGRYWRWRVLTLAVGAKQQLWSLIVSCNRSIWLGLVTPGRVGEFRRAADLSVVRGWGLAASSSLVLIDLLIDLGAYTAIGLGGFLYLSLAAPWGPILAGAVLVGAVSMLFALGGIAGQAARLFPILLRVPGFAELLPALGGGLPGGRALQVVMATTVAAIAYITMIWCLVHPMQPDLDVGQIGASVGLAGVAGAIPITYFGLGTRDIMLVSFFAHLGRPAEQAVAVSFSILLAQVIGIFVSLAAEPVLGVAAKRNDRREKPGG